MVAPSARLASTVRSVRNLHNRVVSDARRFNDLAGYAVFFVRAPDARHSSRDAGLPMSVIFISHSSRDAPVTAALAADLRSAGHRELFLDFDPEAGIPAGRDWEREIYQQLKSARAVLVLCSAASSASRWCFAEVAMAKSLGKHVFPIRIQPCWCATKPCSCINPVLAARQVIDMSSDRSRALGQLWRGLKETAGLDPLNSFDWDGTRAPYPGLSAYQEGDSAVFFGRDEEIRAGLDGLNRLRSLGSAKALLVLGGSGSGKSSLVRAGMLPRLRRSDQWLVLTPIRPRGAPLRELAMSVSAAFASYGVARERKALEHELVTAEAVADIVLDLRVAAGRRDATVLLTIDQGEELLTPDDGAAAHFVALIADVLTLKDSGLIGLFTLRSDFLDPFQRTRIGQLEMEDLRVGPLSTERLREVVEGPASVAGIESDPALTDALLRDTEGRDALPLLAFTLRELYERAGASGRLDVTTYRRDLGGLEGALATVAESAVPQAAVTGDTLTRDLRSACLSMVRLDDETTYSRRPIRWSRLPSSVHATFERLVQARLFVTGETGGERTVEVAHEVLFRAWAPLRDWLAESRVDLYRAEVLRAAAREWNAAARSPELIVHRGGRLDDAEALLFNPAVVFDESERDYVAACRVARQAAREAQRRMADTARVAIATDWLARDPTTAALVLLEVENPAGTSYALNRMSEALSQPLAKRVWRSHTDGVRTAVFSPDGGKVATASDDHTGRVWRVEGDDAPVLLVGHDAGVRTIAFSPDGARLLTASEDSTARIWNVDGSGHAVILAGHADGVLTAAFDATGTRVVTASRDGTARVWTVDSSDPPIVLTGHEGMVTAATFSPSGDRVLTAGADGTARVWTLGDAVEPVVFRHDRAVLAAAFSPDGQRCVTGTMSGTATVWPLDGTTDPIQLSGHSGAILSVAFSADGTAVVTGSSDKLAAIWRLDGSDPVAVRGHEGAILAATFSADGTRVLSASDDGLAVVTWVDGSSASLALRGHTASLYGARFDPSGDRVVTASGDGTVRLWTVDGSAEPRVLGGTIGVVSCVAFSQDGAHVATAAGRGRLLVWPCAETTAPVEYEGLSGTVEALRLCNSGWVAAAVVDGEELGADLVVWSAGREVRFKGHTKRIFNVDLTQDGTRVVTSSSDGTARIWTVDGSLAPIVIEQAQAVGGVWFSPDGERIATFASGTLRVRSRDGSRVLTEVSGYRGSVKTVRFSGSDCIVVMGDDDGTVFVWPAGRVGAPVVLKGHTKFVVCAEFNASGDRLATASWDSTIRVWTTAGDDDPLVLRGHQDQINCLAFSPSGDQLVSGACDRTARMWSLSGDGLRAAIRRSTLVTLEPTFRERFLGGRSETDSGALTGFSP